MQPRWSGDARAARPAASRLAPGAQHKPRLKQLDPDDPLGALLGVTMSYALGMRDSCDTGIAPPRPRQDKEGKDGKAGGSDQFDGEYQFTCVTVPGARYPLVLETGHEVLMSQP